MHRSYLAGMAHGLATVFRFAFVWTLHGCALQNTASRMESTSKPGRIQVSEHTYKLLEDSASRWEETGGVEVKGGSMATPRNSSATATSRLALGQSFARRICPMLRTAPNAGLCA